MRSLRSWAAVASMGLVVSAAGTAAVLPTASAAPSRTALAGTLAPAADRHTRVGSVPASTVVSFDLSLALRNQAGAEAIAKTVTDPASPGFHHYLTDAAWESTYGPSQAEVTAAETWLRHAGFTVGAVPQDRLIVPAAGTAATIDKAFSTTLGYYKVNGHTVQMADSTPSIPSSISSSVTGLVGINQYLATPALAPASPSASTATADATPAAEPPPPAAFKNPPLCSAYWGQKLDTKDPASLTKPYTSPLPYDICGYTPGQLQSAYGLSSTLSSGDNGKGVTIAIVDAYDSPTLLSEAQKYFQENDPSDPLSSAQFTNDEPKVVDDEAECAASGWYSEQALDVEASHTMAPGANILFVGGSDCVTGLLTGLQTAVVSGASVVSNSWLDTLGDVFDDAATKATYDATFMLADATGVSVMFSSGDQGDNFADYGIDAPDYPASSPYVTAVGGTSLEINSSGARSAEYGWSTGKIILCEPPKTENCGTAAKPVVPLAYDYGDGGGTSYTYAEPYYQVPVVPSALALRNQAVSGVAARVLPDISMDADPNTGFLIGLDETFPDGQRYGQYKEGGTSLASPLLAGVIADADQASGAPLGFLNPVLYKAYSATPAVFNDIVPPAHPHQAATIRIDYLNSLNGSGGYEVSLRSLDYEGPEVYCDGTGNCATRPVTLTTAKGFDSMTGLGSIATGFIADLAKY